MDLLDHLVFLFHRPSTPLSTCHLCNDSVEAQLAQTYAYVLVVLLYPSEVVPLGSTQGYLYVNSLHVVFTFISVQDTRTGVY
jgi:hypothetical protein